MIPALCKANPQPGPSPIESFAPARARKKAALAACIASWKWFTRFMLARLLIVLGLVLMVAGMGCGKQAAPASSAPNASAPASEQSAEPGGLNQAQLNALLAELTQTVRKYSAEKQRAPQSLDELVANGYLTTIPPAPAGKKFAIDKKLQVVLTSQ